MDIEASVRDFLRDQVAVRHGEGPVSPDESLLDSGLLDSASILELVAFLEDRFDLVIEDEELLPQNFETITSIVALVETKKAVQAPGDDASS
jgi:acyl carrier protein